MPPTPAPPGWTGQRGEALSSLYLGPWVCLPKPLAPEPQVLLSAALWPLTCTPVFGELPRLQEEPEVAASVRLHSGHPVAGHRTCDWGAGATGQLGRGSCGLGRTRTENRDPVPGGGDARDHGLSTPVGTPRRKASVTSGDSGACQRGRHSPWGTHPRPPACATGRDTGTSSG